MEDLARKQNRNQIWILLISGLVSVVVLLSTHIFFSQLFSAVSLMSMAFNVICSYFFYQLFDFIGNRAGVHFQWRGFKFFYEFLKLIIAIFCAASI
ncbi:hypothetical protein K2X05_11360, partial [bacterium]|nr:hypothetical protein [bacterium]